MRVREHTEYKRTRTRLYMKQMNRSTDELYEFSYGSKQREHKCMKAIIGFIYQKYKIAEPRDIWIRSDL